MKIYLVGGAVRDKLLGIPPKDFDYVALDTSSQELLSLGYQKVGSHFPVFLHPKTRDEYALPRGATLEEDLSQRDLTMNAMALDESGTLFDPFGGSRDLSDKILRHVSDAFADDVLRVFRVFRFQALYPDFIIASETLELMKRIVATREWEKIIPERVLLEMTKGLETKKPSVFFEGLKTLGALEHYFPELLALNSWKRTMGTLDKSAELSEDLRVRYSALVLNLSEASIKNMGQRLFIQSDWTEAGIAGIKFFQGQARDATSIVEIFYGIDAFRKPDLIHVLSLLSQAQILPLSPERYFEVIKIVSVNDVAQGLKGKAIGEAMRAERIRRLKIYLIAADK